MLRVTWAHVVLISILFAVILNGCRDCEHAVTPETGNHPDVAPSPDGLILYLPFNGSIADSSGYGYSVEVNGVDMAADRFNRNGNAVSFKRSDSKITANIPPTLQFTHGLTASVWVHPRERMAQSVLQGMKGFNSWTLACSQTGEVIFTIMNHPPYIARPGYRLNTWTHIAVTHDSSWARLYIGGVLIDSRQGSFPLPDSLGPILIGTSVQSIFNTFSGGIDEVMIYNRALPPEEIARLAGLIR